LSAAVWCIGEIAHASARILPALHRIVERAGDFLRMGKNIGAVDLPQIDCLGFAAA
jgi:hypothetical protein